MKTILDKYEKRDSDVCVNVKGDMGHKYDLRQFYKDLEEFHIVLTDSQAEQFLVYYEMLTEKNKVMNLTAITEFDEVMKKHFVDSLSLVKAFDLHGDGSGISLIDIGTGAGFPGIQRRQIERKLYQQPPLTK